MNVINVRKILDRRNLSEEEGGYEIIFKSLIHYERLKTIHASPEVKEAAAMFAPVLQSQKQKEFQ